MIAAFISSWIAPYALRLAIGAVALVAAGGGFIALKLHYENVGFQRAVHDVAVQNEEAIRAVDAARLRVRSCDATDGMRWDQVARDCVARP